jgi:membrane protein DedA with SNARE-associated domain
MWWQYLLVFLGSFLFDIVPVPFPPAFTIMIFLQIKFDLNIWLVIVTGVAGSVLGRYTLTRYIPAVSKKFLSKSKHDDCKYLGEKLQAKTWRSHLIVFVYSLMPLPTVPLFIAAGIAKLKPSYILPAFTVAKLISNAIFVMIGDYAAKNTNDVLHGVISPKSIIMLTIGFLLIFALLFLDWRELLQHKRFKLRFAIWKKSC